jgi:uncharacterized protein (TIGR00288 family)
MRVGLFIDVSNLYHGAKSVYQKKVNYEALYKFVEHNIGPISVAKAYGVQDKDEAEPFIGSLKKFGYTPIYKKARTYGKITKGDIDTKLTVEVIEHLDDFDFLFLGSADADFLPLVEHAISKGKQVLIMGCNVSHSFESLGDICCEIHKGLLI